MSNSWFRTFQGKAVAILQMPPPVNGLSTINAEMMKAMDRRNLLAGVVNLSPSTRGSSLSRRTRRLSRILWAFLLLPVYRIRGASLVYIPPDAAKGILVQLPVLLFARILGFRVWYHHHNSSYIDRKNKAMNWLVYIGPLYSKHIVLCSEMARRFSKLYGPEIDRSKSEISVLSNGFAINHSYGSRLSSVYDTRDGVLTIGHLSNLTIDKGILVFIEIFEELRRIGIKVKAVVAGPASDPDVSRRINLASDEYGDMFNWIGPVYDDEKWRFYQSIDVFVFPTTYVNEAQPLVLLEALSNGVAIVATDRGCIECDHADSPGLILSPEIFSNGAVKWLRDLAENMPYLSDLSNNCRQRFARIQAASTRSLEGLLDEMAAACRS